MVLPKQWSYKETCLKVEYKTGGSERLKKRPQSWGNFVAILDWEGWLEKQSLLSRWSCSAKIVHYRHARSASPASSTTESPSSFSCPCFFYIHYWLPSTGPSSSPFSFIQRWFKASLHPSCSPCTIFACSFLFIPLQFCASILLVAPSSAQEEGLGAVPFNYFFAQ